MVLVAAFGTSSADTLTVTDSHFRVYDSTGRPGSLDDVVAALANADVLFIGETHDDPVAHALERRLLERAFMQAHERGVSLSLEMFTRDAQHVLNEYLADLITERHFLAASSPWGNYETDYRPMVEFARAHRLPVVAANAPRRYVNRVTRLGPTSLESLPAYTRAWLPPLPYAGASDVYRAEWDALMAESMAEMMAASRSDSTTADDATDEAAGEEAEADAPAMPTMPAATVTTSRIDEEGGRVHDAAATDEDVEGMAADSTEAAMPSAPMHGGMAYMLDSQSLWDATMAFSIAEHLLHNPGRLVVHAVGAFHVENGTGIPEHLPRYHPGVRQIIVSVRPAEDITSFDPEKHAGLGDFVILSDESLPRTMRN